MTLDYTDAEKGTAGLLASRKMAALQAHFVNMQIDAVGFQ